MRKLLRYLLTGSASVVVTMLMFYLMTALMQTDATAISPVAGQTVITFSDVPLPPPPKPRPRKPERPKPQPVQPPDTRFVTPEPELAVQPPIVDRTSLRPGPGTNIIKGILPGGVQGPSDAEPYALVTIRPQYPPRAAMNQIEGWVTIEFVVTASGQVSDARVIAASPPQIFDAAALGGISQWKFKPAMKNGQPVSRRAVQTLVFKLEQG